MAPPNPADFSRLNTFPIDRRAHKFDVQGQAGLPDAGSTFRQWWDCMPQYLGANAFREVVQAILNARRADRPVVMALGAHVVKVGCSPIICDLIDRGII